MATRVKSKEIQVQKPAQSLQAFQQKLNSGEDLQTGILRPVLITAGGVVALVILYFGFQGWRSAAIERYESGMAQLQVEVQGDGSAPVTPQDLEQRMRERLPRLQALVAGAPGARKAEARAVLASWQLQLDGKSAIVEEGKGPWAALRQAQRHIAMGQGKEATAVLARLRKDADPDEAWSALYWTTLLDADRLLGDRAQALKDVADYKARFRDKADQDTMDRLLKGI